MRRSEREYSVLAIFICYVLGIYTGVNIPKTPQETPPVVQAPQEQQDRLFEAICMVESSGGKNLHGAADDVGPAQITDICLADCNIIVGYNRWTRADRLDMQASLDMFHVYCFRYAPNGNNEDKARLWHRGPSKSRQNDNYGDRYWAKVRKYL